MGLEKEIKEINNPAQLQQMFEQEEWNGKKLSAQDKALIKTRWKDVWKRIIDEVVNEGDIGKIANALNGKIKWNNEEIEVPKNIQLIFRNRADKAWEIFLKNATLKELYLLRKNPEVGPLKAPKHLLENAYVERLKRIIDEWTERGAYEIIETIIKRSKITIGDGVYSDVPPSVRSYANMKRLEAWENSINQLKKERAWDLIKKMKETGRDWMGNPVPKKILKKL